MLEAETHLRTAHAYASFLQMRLALARRTGTRREFAAVSNADLARVSRLSRRLTEEIDQLLEGISPQLASQAAVIADIACQREFELPSPESASRLRLVPVDVSHHRAG